MLLTADLSNPTLCLDDGTAVRHSTLHVFRSRFLTEDACSETIEITNFSKSDLKLPLCFAFQTDFLDMFEIRGVQRERRGEHLPPQVEKDRVTLSYRGLDEKVRTCRILFDPPPGESTPSEAKYVLPLKRGETCKIQVTTHCFEGPLHETPRATESTQVQMERRYKRRTAQGCLIHSSSERFATWLDRSKADILLMATDGEHGAVPYAGIPWFNTIFGRDSLITALQYLWVNPQLACSVLRCLAALQSKGDNAYEDAEPGKIIHELRDGEMVDTGEVPFRRYYGSVDSTPLFLILAASYFEATADRHLIERIWPAIESALNWIDRYGDLDGDGFVEYARRSPKGLNNQGWKDSPDSVSHANGELAKGPIALCEAQGYVYLAKVLSAKLCHWVQKGDWAQRLESEAAALKKKFVERFWLPDQDFVAIALDGEKKPCSVLSSNAGQCLFTGILDLCHAEKLGEKLLGEAMFTGWGIRTLGSHEARFNPMSYHNGSVWPHDNSLIAAGFARYGMKDEVLKITEALFDVSVNIDLYRLPELFCGFPRREGQGPTLYPVACSPQSWAAGTVFHLLRACLGMQIDGLERRISLSHPVLPHAIEELRIRHLSVADAQVDLMFKRHGSEVSVYVENRRGKVDIAVLK
jgi:glycogen debranching enzyme